MKIVVGLGNPGPRYRGTLHNVGFDVVEEVARRHGVGFEWAPADALVARLRGLGDGVLLVKPLTFMNVSGQAVGPLVRFYKVPLEDVLIVVDDVALPAGRLRLRSKGSAGGHNGLKSIIGAVGTDAFPRLRVGVGRGDPRRDLAAHVLGRPDADVRERLATATVAAADGVELFVTQPLEDVMRRVNAPGDTPGAAGERVENGDAGPDKGARESGPGQADPLRPRGQAD
jgi:PTH1 family peptidyl-tRNA hydrolase